MSKGLRGVAIGALLTVLFIGAVPATVVGAFYADHALSYTGTCGPYAPDIDAYACTYQEYSANFFGGFSGIGLFMIAIVAAGGAGLVTLFAWAVVGLLMLLRSSRSTSGP